MPGVRGGNVDADKTAPSGATASAKMRPASASLDPAAVKPTAPRARASAASGKEGSVGAVGDHSEQGGWVRPALPDMTPQPEVRAWVANSLEVARQLKQKGSLRQACEAWKQILVVSPAEKECYVGLAEASSACDRYEEALDYYSQCLTLCRPSDKKDDGDVDILVKIGEISLKAADYQAALLFTQRALEKRLQRDPADPCDSIQVLMGKVLYASGNQDTAIQLYTNVLQRNEHSTDALREYAKAYVDRQRPKEALRILLRVLVHAPNDNETRGCLSDIIKARGGLDVLFAELGDAASSGPALAFMATLIKDYGAVEEAVVLYYKALAIVPDMNTYVLNLVHTLEVCNRYQEAMDLCVSYCKKHANMRIGSHHTNGQVASLFDGITDLYNRKFKLPFLDGTSHPGIKDTVVWVPNYGSVVVAKGQEASVSVEGSTALPSPAAAAPDKAAQKIPPYSSDELDLMALHFTMVKILYVVGAVALIPGLVKLIEESRRGWDMHLTTIRNEHAYYCCVAQLMCDIPHPYPVAEKTQGIYVAGDSHSLSTAWQILTVHGKPTPLIPKLVTGLKCWHLRPESVFFPKNNFYNVMASIPRGARVLFLFGEIDCREGIIRAVEKGRYTDIEQGVAVTIEYYMTALQQLHKDNDWNIFVQPVAPVLNETREVVKVFNRVLKEMVEAIPCLQFLDIMSGLLTADGSLLHPDYEMDGTHMSPKYVRLLEQSLNSLPPDKCLPNAC